MMFNPERNLEDSLAAAASAQQKMFATRDQINGGGLTQPEMLYQVLIFKAARDEYLSLCQLVNSPKPGTGDTLN